MARQFRSAEAGSAEGNLPQELVSEMQALYGKHTGYRTTHAKGLLVEGTFTPTEQAKTLSIAAHFNNASTPVVARFSVGGGMPRINDADTMATPKGLAIRFKVDDDTRTDLIAHSFNGFATRTPEDFLQFLKLVRQKDSVEFKDFVKGFPTVGEFLENDQQNPHNYGTITYYQPNTHVLTNDSGKATNVRYRLIPEDGNHLYTKDEVSNLLKNYLEDDLEQRFPEKPIVFTIQAHIAGSDDVLDDATIPYKSKTFVPIGKLEINKVSDDNADEQQTIAFSPVPSRGGIEGMKASKDPLIEARNSAYWTSADQRRHEKRTE